MGKRLIFLVAISFLIGALFPSLLEQRRKVLSLQDYKKEQLKKILEIEEPSEWPEVKVLKRERIEGMERRLLGFASETGSITAYLLLPETTKRFPLIIAIPGHGSSKEEVVGMADFGNNADYGLRLAKAGFVVLAPDVRVSADWRREDLYSLNLLLYGKTLNGVRLADIFTFLEYAQSLLEVDREKIGCVGWSLGGALAMFLQ
jgi:cephalosporin-C deacetylase-like acetyl esterase